MPNARKKLRAKKRYIQQMSIMLMSILILAALCVVIVGILNIVKNSPDHSLVILRDRQAPVVKVHNAVSANGKTYEITDFVDSIDDITDVTMDISMLRITIQTERSRL